MIMYSLHNNSVTDTDKRIDYEPQQTLPCTPPPLQNCREWVHFFCIGVWCTQKNVLKGKEYFGVIQVKGPQDVFFHYIHSNEIFINLLLFHDIE